VTVAVDAATDDDDRAAAAAGFVRSRELLQLRRTLPIPETTSIVVRPVRHDDTEGWLEVNNRAFAWHPEQSDWTAERLGATQAEDWFDPDGFLVHDGPDGRLDGFCWTKVHAELDPPVGEIFVIAADPSTHGTGLGRALVLAGLRHLANAGLTEAMLYVEADNAPALRLYESLGFSVAAATRWYTWTKGAGEEPDRS